VTSAAFFLFAAAERWASGAGVFDEGLEQRLVEGRNDGCRIRTL